MIGVVRLGSRRRKDATAARMTSRAAVPHLGTPGRVPTECDVPPVYILVPKRYYGRPRGTLYVLALTPDSPPSRLRVALHYLLYPLPSALGSGHHACMHLKRRRETHFCYNNL